MERRIMKKILITGGAGTVGSSFIKQYYNDFKFQALRHVLKSKEKLKTVSSRREVVLINRIISKNDSFVFKLKNKYLKFKYSTVAFLIPFTKKIRVYNFAKWLYKKIN